MVKSLRYIENLILEKFPFVYLKVRVKFAAVILLSFSLLQITVNMLLTVSQ